MVAIEPAIRTGLQRRNTGPCRLMRKKGLDTKAASRMVVDGLNTREPHEKSTMSLSSPVQTVAHTKVAHLATFGLLVVEQDVPTTISLPAGPRTAK